MRIIFLIICLLLISLSAFSQVRIAHLQQEEKGLVLEDLWQIQLQNLSGAQAQVVLVSEVRREGQLVYRKSSKPVFLPPGQQTFHPALLQTDQEYFHDRELGKTVSETGHFPPGTYQICLLVKSPGGSGELGRDCRQKVISIQAADEGLPAKKFQLSGRGNVEYFYTDQPFWGQEGSRQYVRFDLQPRVQWQDIPLGVDIFYTTNAEEWASGMNAISLHFDARRFQEQLRDKLQGRLKARAAKIQRTHARDFSREAQLARQLDGLSDSAFTQARAILPELERRLKDYPEKELRYRERQLRRALEEQAHTPGLHPDSLDAEYAHLEKERSRIEKQLAVIQQKMAEMEQLKRQINAAEQKLQQYRQLQDRSGFLRSRHEHLKGQNDSLRQLLPDLADLSHPAGLKRQLRREGLFKKSYGWLFAIQELSIGTYRPNYSPLILNGTQANGLSLSIRPEQEWEFSASLGKVQEPVWSLGTSNGLDEVAPVVAAGKIAWRGKQLQPYLLAAVPFQKSVPNSDESINAPPAGTLKLGAGTAFRFFDQRFTGQLDGAWSNPLPDTPGETPSTFSQRTAVSWYSQWEFSQQTRFSAVWQTVGSAYEDIGSPFLLAGMEQIDLQLEHNFWKDQLRAGLFYLKDKNRPIGYSPFTFQNHQYGLQINWQANGLPSVFTRLGRNLLSNEGTENQSWLWNLTANYPYQLGKLQLVSQVSFQHTQQQLNEYLAPQFYTYLEARQQFTWSQSFSTALSLYRNTGSQADAITDFSGIDLQLAFRQKGWQLNLIAGKYRQGESATDHRINLQCRIPVSKKLYLNLQAGRQPSFVDTEVYHFVRTGIGGLF